jgi:YHS domain-containing protein
MYGFIFFLLFTLFLGFVIGWRYAKYESPRSLTERVRFGFAQGRDEIRWIAPETDLDCVCGQTIKTSDAKPSVHDGLVYYFCSCECREKFETTPSKFVAGAGLWPR